MKYKNGLKLLNYLLRYFIYYKKKTIRTCEQLSKLKVCEIVIFVLSAQNDCFLLAHENEFLVETVRSRL
jgi:hypothetical protein